jgi:hypothetical protein
MYDQYVNYINSFINNDVNNWDFKSDISYQHILEHTSNELGNKYLEDIIKKYSVIYDKNKDYLIELSNQNDSIGKPNKYDFSNFTICSPSNLRYILHSFLILEYMNKCKLNNIDIIEIGGGYGGLCFFMIKLAQLFNITINTYTIFDLKNPSMLQNKYLENLNINLNNINCVQINNFKNINKNSFLISNYAYSEISLDLQKEYTEKILNPYVSYGFLTWNFIEVYKFINNKIITYRKEVPSSGNNFYVYFKPTLDETSVTLDEPFNESEHYKKVMRLKFSKY